jgi:hypothetical protein
MMRDNIATVFALRRNMETGKLELDAYIQVDYADLQLQRAVAQGIAALEGKGKFDDPVAEAEQILGGIKIRAKCDGAIVGVYGWRGETVMDRDEFWDSHGHWPLTKFKQFKI